MPCIIRRRGPTGFVNHAEVAPDSWRLREQVEALEEWLAEHMETLDPEQEWVTDIGFCGRRDARGGGPPISRRLMRLCLRANLEIHLSEYPGEA